MNDNVQSQLDDYIKLGKSVCCQLALEIEKLKEKGVSFYFFRLPTTKDIKNPSEFEQKINELDIDGNNVLDLISKKEIEMVMHKKYDTEYVNAIFNSISPVVRCEGVLVHTDSRNPYFNVVGGTRVTTDIPKDYINKIHIFGKSQCLGMGVEDKETISSYLQRECNRSYNERYCVVNYGVGGVSYQEILLHVQKHIYSKGDIVIIIQHIEDFMYNYLLTLGVWVDNMIFEIFSRPHDMGEIFFDRYHINAIANHKIAKHIIKTFLNYNLQSKINVKYVYSEIKNLPNLSDNNKDITEMLEIYRYLDEIKLKIGDIDGKIGSIVMNCNPFTYGHRYLIEYAKKYVDHLIIFVVEEDSSYFSFNERYEMVQLGCKDLEYVYVVPSGKFIISSITFPQYFKKEKIKDILVDPSLDVHIFGKKIANSLGISVRFIGEEPFDLVTRQYNETLKSILPQYGIDCHIVSRKKINGEIISASRVRELLTNSQYDQLQKFVPITTYQICVCKGN